MNEPFKTKTKIVGTLGPASSTTKMIGRMLEQGLTVARINMSHGSHEEHSTAIKNARLASKNTKCPLAILQDLSGPKIRIGDFDTEEITLENGKSFILTTETCTGTKERVFVNYPSLPQEIEVGMNIYLNDGKQKLLVDKIDKTDIHTTIISGGTIRGRRGVNVPDANLSISSLTQKDRKDLKFGLSQNVDFVTLSFVRTADDINLLRKLIGKNHNVSIVAKIETKTAIENLEEIIKAADAIMVARGDLAIEVPLEKVPLLQKRIIRLANIAGKPVITATQMLDSMRLSVTPTRAEVTDIANAILDGTDALMLSDESAIGVHPDRAIEIMTQVAFEIENDPYFTERKSDLLFTNVTACNAITSSIADSVRLTNAKVIVALSESGKTAQMIARHRSKAPILVITPHQETYNKMLLVFGCEPIIKKGIKNMIEAQRVARQIVTKRALVKENESFILGAGIPFGNSGATNTMLIDKL
jgi:pyruvate kinase